MPLTMSTETLNQRMTASIDLAAGYLLWMLSQGRKIGEQSMMELQHSDMIVEVLTSVVSPPSIPTEPHHRRFITVETNEVQSSSAHDTVRSPLLVAVSDSECLPSSSMTLIDEKPLAPGPRICSPTPHEEPPTTYTSSDTTSFPEWFRQSKTTVVIGKGHLPRKTPGNILLRQMVQDRINDYKDTNRRGRAAIVSEIYHNLVRMNPTGRSFGNFDFRGDWCEARENSARDKIAASFRDCLSHLYKSSTQSKVAKRRTRKAEKSTSRNCHI